GSLKGCGGKGCWYSCQLASPRSDSVRCAGSLGSERACTRGRRNRYTPETSSSSIGMSRSSQTARSRRERRLDEAEGIDGSDIFRSDDVSLIGLPPPPSGCDSGR